MLVVTFVFVEQSHTLPLIRENKRKSKSQLKKPHKRAKKKVVTTENLYLYVSAFIVLLLFLSVDLTVFLSYFIYLCSFENR